MSRTYAAIAPSLSPESTTILALALLGEPDRRERVLRHSVHCGLRFLESLSWSKEILGRRPCLFQVSLTPHFATRSLSVSCKKEAQSEAHQPIFNKQDNADETRQPSKSQESQGGAARQERAPPNALPPTCSRRTPRRRRFRRRRASFRGTARFRDCRTASPATSSASQRAP